MRVGIHITHEVFHKIGGIGPIIHGLCTADRYKAVFEKTVLYGPLFSSGTGVFSRLGKGGEVLYSNHDNYDCGNYHGIFLDIIKEFNIDIVYGKRSLVNEFNINKKNTIDIILVGVNKMNADKVNLFKHKLWKNFAIESDRYSEWDYEQYLRIGGPYLDIIFTHVTRLVPSKGIWRDISLLYILDELFYKSGIKGAYILLSTLVGTGREASQISSMEKEYGWPIIHREGWPDLVGAESETYSYLSHFNSRSKGIKGVFINQFGFDRRKCGEKVPKEADFLDLRIGSDVELGFSIYEPFGKAQLEVLPFGGTPVVSSSCGCSYLVKNRFQDLVHKPFAVLDFIGGTKNYLENTDLSSITVESRFELEQKLFSKTGKHIFMNLPKSDSERLRSLDTIQERFKCLGWEKIVSSMDFSAL